MVKFLYTCTQRRRPRWCDGAQCRPV